MGNIVVHIKAIADDIVQLHIQSVYHNIRNLAFKLIHALCCFMADRSQLVAGVFDMGCKGTIRYWMDSIFNQIKQFFRIIQNDFFNELFIIQPCKLLKHLTRQSNMLIRILCFSSQVFITDVQWMRSTSYTLRHDINITEYFLFRSAVMCITVRNHRNSHFLCGGNQSSDHCFQPINGW